MNCIVCDKETTYAFCKTCTPSYGEIVTVGKRVIYMGEIGLLHAVKMRLKGYNVIRWWLGSDSLMLHRFPPGRGKLSVILHRIKAFLLDFVATENWADNLETELSMVKWLRLKNLRRKLWCGKHTKYPKQAHKGINLAFYSPNESKFSTWKYGADLVEAAMKQIDDPCVNWIRLKNQDMSKIYPILDGYLRPSRHDGWPRLVEESLLNEIPILYRETFDYTEQSFLIDVKNLIQHIKTRNEHAC